MRMMIVLKTVFVTNRVRDIYTLFHLLSILITSEIRNISDPHVGHKEADIQIK